jgi:hypothetical protein
MELESGAEARVDVRVDVRVDGREEAGVELCVQIIAQKRVLVYDFGPMRARLDHTLKSHKKWCYDFFYKNGMLIYIILYVFAFIAAVVYCGVTYMPKGPFLPESTKHSPTFKPTMISHF